MPVRALFLLSLMLVGLRRRASSAGQGNGLGNENVTPHFEDGVLVARDGTRLPLREWDADGDHRRP